MSILSTYFDPEHIELLGAQTSSLVERRLRALGPAYRLFYERPVELVRGHGTHLFDSEGNAYLDAYNNVPSVGHAHPRVVEAVHQQMGRLNTHTRYVHEGIVNYSEQLLDLFPSALDTIMFACTGSEANDLALRIAKYRSGNSGVIVTANAYHGVTTEVAAVSPSLGSNNRLPVWTRTVRAPDPFRIDHAAEGFGSLSEWFAAEVAAAIRSLTESGLGVAALLIDTVMSSDGMLTQRPVGLLAPALALVRAAGGMVIADEVQAGFGRTGGMWGFTRHEIEPDIVTLGKPMGAGLPISAAVMSADVIAQFGKDMRYFNTFGGNAVSIAAAQAVLDVLRDEDLVQNARTTGDALGVELVRLGAENPSIGDVRGVGLFWGVEFIHNDAERTPDPIAASSVVNALRDLRVLVSATGPHNHVLKIRPPLCFSAADVGELSAALTAALPHLEPRS
jgi:4-aminobutyrate aminotransferase-like enzyme